MSGFSNSPKLFKGAIMYLDPLDPIPKIIRFQYNPDTMTRSVQGQSGGGGEGSAKETFRIDAAPIETINLDIEFDATDYLEHPNENIDTVTMGIQPKLSALEMLLYPKSSEVIKNETLKSQGFMEIIPPQSPLTIFVWGLRMLPVKITKCDITEEAFDVLLNPLRAKVSLGLQVLSYSNFSPQDSGYQLFLAHHRMKESMAIIGQARSL
jgi:hypothetical protein